MNQVLASADFNGVNDMPATRRRVSICAAEPGGFEVCWTIREGNPEMKNPQVNELLGDSNVGGVDDRFGPNLREAENVASCLQASIKAALV